MWWREMLSCRRRSYNARAPATDTFSDSTHAFMGTERRCAANASTTAEGPSRSLPSSMATRSFIAARREMGAVAVALRLTTTSCALRTRSRSCADDARTTGK